jgi:hypothetical protein
VTTFAKFLKAEETAAMERHKQAQEKYLSTYSNTDLHEVLIALGEVRQAMRCKAGYASIWLHGRKENAVISARDYNAQMKAARRTKHEEGSTGSHHVWAKSLWSKTSAELRSYMADINNPKPPTEELKEVYRDFGQFIRSAI